MKTWHKLFPKSFLSQLQFTFTVKLVQHPSLNTRVCGCVGVVFKVWPVLKNDHHPNFILALSSPPQNSLHALMCAPSKVEGDMNN